MRNQDLYQERRCQVGLHNFPTYDNDNELLVCKRCKYMQLPYDVREGVTEKEKKIIDTFKNIHYGHECRDGTINFDKTW